MELLRFGDQGWGDEMALATAMTLSLAVASFALGLVLAVGGAADIACGARRLFVAMEHTTHGGNGTPEPARSVRASGSESMPLPCASAPRTTS